LFPQKQICLRRIAMIPFFRTRLFLRNIQDLAQAHAGFGRASQKSLASNDCAPVRSASESPTFVAFTLALFVFLSAVSMMTAAQTGAADQASLRATPVAYHEPALGSGASSREDDCCDDAVVAPTYLLAGFDYAKPAARILIGRNDLLARNFNARGPPARS
jgi:hypothetical protein